MSKDARLVDAELRASGLRWAMFSDRETRHILAALDLADRHCLVRKRSTIPALLEELRHGLDREVQAARRRNASPEVWATVHEAHGERESVRVQLEEGDVVLGEVVAIDEDGFEVDGPLGVMPIQWAEAAYVERAGSG